MDFEKLKSAAEEIKLSDSEKEKLIAVCEASKTQKKKSRYVPAAIVAAAAMFIIVLFSPGFLFQAKMADSAAPQENAAADYEYLADSAEQYVQDGLGSVTLHSGSTVRAFRMIYYEIPEEFRLLVSESEYNEWEKKADTADGMMIMQFVSEFGITRGDFDSANAAYAQRIFEELGMAPLLRAADCAEQEQAEVFNADIVYSMNKATANEYYSVPEYEFSSMEEFAEAVKNGYASLSEKAEIIILN